MKSLRYKPYNCDIGYEKRTYKYIGKDYGDAKTANKGVMSNFFRWFRKYIYNRNEKFYKFCHNHGEWIEHLRDSDIYHGQDRKDFIAYLMQKKRTAEIMLDMVKVLVIPVYIALFSIMPSIETTQKLALTEVASLWFFIIGISVCLLKSSSLEVYFYHDYIKYFTEQ